MVKIELRTLKVRILNSVPGPGIEPGWIAPPVFETGASTDSAIRANRCDKGSVFFWSAQINGMRFCVHPVVFLLSERFIRC